MGNMSVPREVGMRLSGATAALLLLVACAPANGQSQAPVKSGVDDPSPSVTVALLPSPSPSASATPSAPASFPADLPTGDAESAAIIEGWQAYWRVFEKFAADPSLTDLTETQHVTTGEEADAILVGLAHGRERNVKSVGTQQFRAVQLSPTRQTAAGREADISYCADLSAVRLVDAETGAPVERGGSDTFHETATMREGVDGTWRVAQIRNEEATC